MLCVPSYHLIDRSLGRLQYFYLRTIKRNIRISSLQSEIELLFNGVYLSRNKWFCHNEQTAAWFIYFGLGHVPPHIPITHNFSVLHFTHSNKT